LASELDPKNTTAAILKDTAWEKLTGYEPGKEDQLAAALFQKKLAGYAALENNRFIDAYYTFKELSESDPGDPEVRQFLAASREGISTTAFFKDEAERSTKFPSVPGIIFLADSSEESTVIVTAENMSESPEGTFFYTIEALSFAGDGDVNYHLRAPYGKLIGEHINLNCLDRDTPTQTWLPVYRVGEPDERGLNVRLSIDVRFLAYYSPESLRIDRMSFYELWSIRRPFSRAGFQSRDVEMEIVTRIAMPFLFLIISLLSVSFAWRLRADYPAKPPFVTYLFLPILPFIISPILTFIYQAHYTVFGLILSLSGLTIAITALVTFQLLLLIVALFIAAGKFIA
jgi:hypothetical protein